VKEMLYHLDQNLKPGTDDYDVSLNAMMKELHEHGDSEEKEDLPLLEPFLGVEESKKVAASFDRTKYFVPTR
jgi:hypothetical protein